MLLAFIDQTGANPLWLLSGEGRSYRSGLEDSVLSDLSPIQLIRRGLEKLEQEPSDVVFVAPENLPDESMSDFVAISLVPLAELARGDRPAEPGRGAHPRLSEVAAAPQGDRGRPADDDAMAPILPAGSVVAVDRSVTDPERLQGRMVAACPDGVPMIRWLDLSGRHLILRPNQPTREHPLIPVELDGQAPGLILGQVVWSWSCFNVEGFLSPPATRSSAPIRGPSEGGPPASQISAIVRPIDAGGPRSGPTPPERSRSHTRAPVPGGRVGRRRGLAGKIADFLWNPGRSIGIR